LLIEDVKKDYDVVVEEKKEGSFRAKMFKHVVAPLLNVVMMN
jgi:hypothetical protein